MTDFETMLAGRVTDLVDHEAGSPRTAPAFIPTEDHDRERRPVWTRWALAAAVIALVAGLTWAGLTRMVVTQGPSVAGPPSGTASALSPSPSVLSSTAVDSPGPAATQPTTTVVGDMTLVLPAGWVVAEMVYPKGTSGVPGATEWCIDPSGARDTCTIHLTAARAAAGNPLDVDIEGGWLSNPSYCFDERATNPKGVKETLDVADVQPFGGRESEHRVWTHTCSASKVIHVEQYEVAYAPAWILFSELADSTVSATMREIAQKSTLPAQTLPVRLTDRGHVRSIRATSAGYVIALDRIYLDPSEPSGEINNASVTYEYTVPKALLLTKVPIVGDRVGIVTNGSIVTDFSFYGG